MIEIINNQILPAAYQLLPLSMQTPQASAMLLATGLQESRFQHRRQVGGPAKGFWQFETAGLSGVLAHHTTGPIIKSAMLRLSYPATLTQSTDIITAVEHNDILAACFARCLLWTSPQPLSNRTDAAAAYALYVSLWRPGRPLPLTWPANYATAWAIVSPTP